MRATAARAAPLLLLAAPALVSHGCAGLTTRDGAGAGTASALDGADAATPEPDFDAYMRADFAPADGFDFPFGDGDGGVPEGAMVVIF